MKVINSNFLSTVCSVVRRTPARSRAVKQSAELQSSLELFATAQIQVPSQRFLPERDVVQHGCTFVTALCLAREERLRLWDDAHLVLSALVNCRRDPGSSNQRRIDPLVVYPVNSKDVRKLFRCWGNHSVDTGIAGFRIKVF